MKKIILILLITLFFSINIFSTNKTIQDNPKKGIIKQSLDWMLSFSTPEKRDKAKIALFFIAFAESSFFPLPPDILLIALAVVSPKLSFLYALICLIGSVLGGGFGYLIGFFGGRPLLNKLVKKEKIQSVESLFKKYDFWAISIAGFTPIPYKVFTIASGAFNINFKNFTIASILGRGGRFFIIATLFYFFGKPIKILLDKYLNIFSIILVIIIIIGYLAMGKIAKNKNNEGK